MGAGVAGPPRIGEGGGGPEQAAEDEQQLVDHRPWIHAGEELPEAELGWPAERGADEDQRGSGHGHQGTVAGNHQRQGDGQNRANADQQPAGGSAPTALGHDERERSAGQADGGDHRPGGRGAGCGQDGVVVGAAEGKAGAAQRPERPEHAVEQ
jgi:hypothetical protein